MRKLHILLYSFYCFWLGKIRPDNNPIDIIFYIGRFIKILTTLIVNILPYGLVNFTWFRIMVYFAESAYNKYIPINLSQLFSDLNIRVRNEGWIRDFYEVHQLDQRIK